MLNKKLMMSNHPTAFTKSDVNHKFTSCLDYNEDQNMENVNAMKSLLNMNFPNLSQFNESRHASTAECTFPLKDVKVKTSVSKVTAVDSSKNLYFDIKK
jgi:hypothetical protein